MKALPYKYVQVRRILLERGLHMERLYIYKQRNPRYNLLDEHGNVIIPYITLNQIRWKLTKWGYPLDYTPNPPPKKRNIVGYIVETDNGFIFEEKRN